MNPTAQAFRILLAGMVLATTAPPARSADAVDPMLAHCATQFERAPEAQRTAFGRLNTALRANDADGIAQGRRIAAAAHDLIKAAHAAVDTACNATLAHIAALASFVGGDAATAAADERTAIAGGIARQGSIAERAEIYVVYGTYLHAAGNIADAIAAERQAVTLTGTARDGETVRSRAEALLALAAFLAETATYAEAVQTYEAVAGDAGVEPQSRMFGALFGGWIRRAMNDDIDSTRDFDRALAFAPNVTSAATVLLYRGLSALQIERYGEAESIGQDIQRRLAGSAAPDAPFLRGLADNLLGSVYLAENRVADAAAAFDRARATLASVSSARSASALIAVQTAEADMYVRLGRYNEARTVIADAVARVGSANPELAMFFNGAGPLVAPLYALDQTAALALGNIAAARDDNAHQLAALRSAPQSIAAASALASRAAIERITGDLPAARRDIDDARALAVRLSATRSLPALNLESARIAYYAGNVPLAKQDFSAAFGEERELFGGVFGMLGERDRLAFAQLSAPLDDAYLTFSVRDAARDPSLGGNAYDVALFRKELVAQTVTALEVRVRASRDPDVARTYQSLLAKRRQLANLTTVSAASDVRTSTAGGLTRDAQDLERSLLARFPGLNANAAGAARWQDVRAALRPGEAAVELVRYREIANRRTDGAAHYAAAVLRAGATAPALIDLGPADAVEGAALLGYRQTGVVPGRRLIPPDRHALERLIWAPLVPALGAAHTVYLAADGVLNTVAFDLLTDDAGRALGDTVDIRLVDSTKDLLATPPAASTAKTALLIGDPSFDLSADQQLAALRGTVAAAGARQSTSFVALRNVTDRVPLVPLPATRNEVGQIDALLRGHGWKTQQFVGAAALQESLERGAHGQTVVHLATHGAFLADPNPPRAEAPLPAVARTAPSVQGDDTGIITPALPLPESVIGTPETDPMLRSLLFFAGADRAWARREAPPAGLESGIFTASDAASLDLHGTELVVLSACETGLGAVQSGDGVLGLRRALREAGAQSVLMSLWQLPDRETGELMAAFYAHYLGGEEMHAALRAAERDERAIVVRRYGSDDPYYWAGFVIVGNGRR